MDSSHAESLVDFSRKTGADLVLLEANTDKRGRGRSRNAKRQRSGGKAEGDDVEDIDIDGTEVTIVDEFGRDRCVARGGPEHRAFLEAMKAAAEKEAQERAESESYDERYSYRGNKGLAAAAGAAPVATAAGQWAWSSGTGRGADEGDFETRERQELRGKKKMKKLLEQEGKEEGAKEESGAKVRYEGMKGIMGGCYEERSVGGWGAPRIQSFFEFLASFVVCLCRSENACCFTHLSQFSSLANETFGVIFDGRLPPLPPLITKPEQYSLLLHQIYGRDSSLVRSTNVHDYPERACLFIVNF